ncbi:DUF2189 domain-containing protein [Arsenicitalea aurantiaca]|uniref:DUF2189 domain-containing protein n=2 Tax=Arsenicitalea aurantiaca TaxID=1783274 RepID=A0A433XE30_9HYPH|nr:DUF2189 domain-containing protein [Arsenicitalea aurantiaca]
MSSAPTAKHAEATASVAIGTLSANAPLGWVAAGWRDFANRPGLSLAYGAAVLAVSAVALVLIILGGWGNVLFPALAAFMIVGPVIAVGLYEKSRLLEMGEKPRLRDMVWVGFRAGQQIFFIGAILALLGVLWMRAAFITYALFFGWRAMPDDFWEVVQVLLLTPVGLAMIATGSVIGALFAALAFAVSAFSIPMLLDRDIDAFTAMGTSTRLAWRNLPAMIAWGAILLLAFIVSVATGLLALVILFPLIGHATWHAYGAVRKVAGDLSGVERRV